MVIAPCRPQPLPLHGAPSNDKNAKTPPTLKAASRELPEAGTLHSHVTSVLSFSLKPAHSGGDGHSHPRLPTTGSSKTSVVPTG